MSPGKIIGWIAVLVIAFAIFGQSTDAKRDDSGAVVESGNVDIFKIKIGDCLTEEGLNSAGQEVTVADATAIPCNEPHKYQAYYVGDVSYDSMPSDISGIAGGICEVEFNNFFGVSVDETALTYMSLFPTVESWENGDREITCLLSNYDDTLLTESFV